MSELRADTITASDGSSPVTLTKQSAAKAWASIDAEATDHPTLDAFNIASTADITTGVTKITFTNGFSNSFYAVSGAGQAQDEAGGIFGIWGRSTTNSRQMTSSHFHTDNRNSSSGGQDMLYFGMSVHGDLL